MNKKLTNDIFFMKKAISEAKIALSNGEVPVGAVIVANNTVIARAHNQTELLNDVTAHAELLAITSASSMIGGKYLHNCTMYVTLEPCSMCAGALYWTQISRIVYGASDLKRGYIKNKTPLHPKTKVVSGVCKNESETLLNNFFENKRN